MAQIVGVFRIGRDAEVRHTAGGDAVCNLSLAFNYGKKQSDGNRPSQWIDASLWGKRAEALAQYLTKGALIYAVISDPHIEEYEGRNGKGNKLAGTVTEIEFAGGKREDSPARAPAPAREERKPVANVPAADYDDDIPF